MSLRCIICYDVAEDAKTCPDCEKLYCHHCIEQWLRRKGDCPQCKRSRFEPQRLNKFAQAIINELVFRCERCAGSFRYEDRVRHYQEKCEYLLMECPAQCTRRFESEKDLRHHLETECLKLEAAESLEEALSGVDTL